MTTTETFALPLDWDVWRKQWAAWMREHEHAMIRVRSPFKGKNFLADEILGVWRVGGRIVEVSEMTFPSFERDERGFLKHDDVRGIGLTFEDGGTVVHSFTELEQVLGL